jgi:hypothetical protein
LTPAGPGPAAPGGQVTRKAQGQSPNGSLPQLPASAQQNRRTTPRIITVPDRR